MGYLKEEGVWKILKIKWVPLYEWDPGDGWVKPERRCKGQPAYDNAGKFPDSWKPDGPPPVNFDYSYPSGYILPFHYRHPVTGKVTSEEKRNKLIR
jgi:hypothetical protein